MPQYLLSVHTGDAPPTEPTSDEEMRRGYERIGALEDEMRAVDALRMSARLTEPAAARVVRRSKGRTITTDGPYAESKEVLGGFYIIEAADLDAALAWAEKTSEAVGMPIEVRPFFDSKTS